MSPPWWTFAQCKDERYCHGQGKSKRQGRHEGEGWTQCKGKSEVMVDVRRVRCPLSCLAPDISLVATVMFCCYA